MTSRAAGYRRATVRNVPGRSARTMAASRWGVALAILVALWLGVFLYAENMQAIVKLGLPGTSVVVAAFLLGTKLFEKRGTVVARSTKRAARGVVAEEEVGALLGSLPEGNFIIHDFDSGKGNIDHILINAKGIFILETKSHRGAVYFDGKQLLNGKRPFEKDFLRQAWAECFTVRKILEGQGITSPRARPILLFTNAYVTLREKARGVEVLSLKYLPKYLERLPNLLTGPEAGRIYNRLKPAS